MRREKPRRTICDDQIAKLVRQKKRQLQALQKENYLSRDMIDKCIKVRDPTQQNAKLFENTQSILKSLTFKHNIETKKNHVLKQIVNLLQQEVMKNEKAQEESCRAAKAVREKQKKKEEYNIQQVLQKHNEEVAKINVLKEEVLAQRSQRVIYSSLFKKLEAQIKHYEEQFKHVLVKSFGVKGELEQTFEMSRKKVQRSNSQINIRDSIKSGSSKEQMTLNEVFLTRQPVRKTCQESNFYLNRLHLEEERLTQLQSFYDSLLKNTGFDEISELLLLPEFQQKNQELLQEIEEINALIEKEEKVMKRMKPWQKIEIDILLDAAVNIFGNPATFLQEDIKTQQEELEKQQETLGKLCRLLQIQQTKSLEDVFQQIETKLSEVPWSDDKQPKKQDDIDPQIDQLLAKAERYTMSEKIYNAQTFRQEYEREVVKLRRQRKK